MSVAVIAFQLYSESPRDYRGILARLLAREITALTTTVQMGSRSRQPAVRARAPPQLNYLIAADHERLVHKSSLYHDQNLERVSDEQ